MPATRSREQGCYGTSRVASRGAGILHVRLRLELPAARSRYRPGRTDNQYTHLAGTWRHYTPWLLQSPPGGYSAVRPTGSQSGSIWSGRAPAQRACTHVLLLRYTPPVALRGNRTPGPPVATLSGGQVTDLSCPPPIYRPNRHQPKPRMSPGWPERGRKDGPVILSKAKDLPAHRGQQPDPSLRSEPALERSEGVTWLGHLG